MALLHNAELRPSKLELITPWLTRQPWAYAPNGDWQRVAAYRFDDPEGEVGVETMIVSAGEGPELQVALTYRGAPLAGADEWLIGTMDHSALGARWVYDAAGDPVYAQTLAFAIANGEHEAEQYLEENGVRTVVPGTARVQGSGRGADMAPAASVTSTTETTTTTIATAAFTLYLARVVDEPLPADAAETLSGSWGDRDASVALAGYRVN
ncbi:MAG: hypothetical protein KF680_03735 [Cryobacterium sp.]|nr:hypothetical protein [Cryobacterium sp.]